MEHERTKARRRERQPFTLTVTGPTFGVTFLALSTLTLICVTLFNVGIMVGESNVLKTQYNYTEMLSDSLTK